MEETSGSNSSAIVQKYAQVTKEQEEYADFSYYYHYYIIFFGILLEFLKKNLREKEGYFEGKIILRNLFVDGKRVIFI